MKVLYLNLQFGYRGTEVATYNLANAAEIFQKIVPVICGTLARPHPALEKFQKRFKTITYQEDWRAEDNIPLRNRLEQIVEEEKIDWCYGQINGFVEDSRPRNCKNFVHCVFQMDQVYGDRYVGISEYLAKKYGRQDFLNYVISPCPVKAGPDLIRKHYGIPADALVLGWSGGVMSFSIPWVTAALPELLSCRQDLWFIFLGLSLPFKHERIIEIPVTMDEEQKWGMISACDAMLSARRDGETFGMSCGEFSRGNKPVIAYDGYEPWHDRAHIDLLGNKALLYRDTKDLERLIHQFERITMPWHGWWTGYEKCDPMNVAEKFAQYLS